MQIYEKVFWKLYIPNSDIKKCMESDIIRKVRKDKEILLQQWFSFGYEPLTEENFNEFTQQLYLPIIGKRANRTPEKIFSSLPPEEIKRTPRYFVFIRQWKRLYGGGIFRQDGEMLKFAYKTTEKDTLWLKAGFGTLIDYLFFSFGIEHEITTFSYGTDKNWYGFLWSSPSVGLHKIFLWFYPYLLEDPQVKEIDINDINIPSLIFSDPNEKGELLSALIIKNDGTINEHLLEKRWFTILHP